MALYEMTGYVSIRGGPKGERPALSSFSLTPEAAEWKSRTEDLGFPGFAEQYPFLRVENVRIIFERATE